MPSAANKLVQSIFWPISVWPSFTHVEEHPADDYVEQTTPIIGTAIGFWACVGGLLILWLLNLPQLNNVVVEGVSLRTSLSSRAGDTAFQVLLFFLPVLYVAGFWMFAQREEEYPN
jgi:hypothetical protein